MLTLDIGFDILSELEALQRRQTALLNDMKRGNAGAGGTPLAAANEKAPDPSEAELDAIASELETYLDSLKPAAQSSPEPPALRGKTEVFETAQPPQPLEGLEFPEVPKAGPAGKNQSSPRKIVSAILFYGFLLFLIGGAFLFSRGNEKPIFGYSFADVLTWSMQSVIPQGSMVVIKQTDPDTIRVGDIVTYMKDPQTSVTHEVIGITENYDNSGARGFETQGVDNDAPDFDIVPAANVVGVVRFHIPKLGTWLEWLRGNLLMVAGFLAGFVLLFFFIRGAFKKRPEESLPEDKRRPRPSKPLAAL